jgi:hypothetical protein
MQRRQTYQSYRRSGDDPLGHRQKPGSPELAAAGSSRVFRGEPPLFHRSSGHELDANTPADCCSCSFSACLQISCLIASNWTIFSLVRKAPFFRRRLRLRSYIWWLCELIRRHTCHS